MTKKERTALLAAGEQELAVFEESMDEMLLKKDFSVARDYKCRYDGAVYMLKALGLLNHEECLARSRTIFDRYMAERYPEHASEKGEPL